MYAVRAAIVALTPDLKEWKPGDQINQIIQASYRPD
jgi:hypothetical protein